MNNLKLLFFLFFFCLIAVECNSQNTDTSRVSPPAPAQKDTSSRQTPADENVDKNTPAPRKPNRQPPPHQKYNSTKQEEFWKKVYWGGNLALSFGTTYGYYEISPNAGYKFNDIISAGPQIIYQNYTYKSGNFHYNFNIYGGGAFVRALIVPQVFLQAEYDVLSVPDNYSVFNNARAISDEKLVGLGLKNSYGGSFSYYLTILYDINPTPQSPYYNLALPLVTRAGFSVNF